MMVVMLSRILFLLTLVDIVTLNTADSSKWETEGGTTCLRIHAIFINI